MPKGRRHVKWEFSTKMLDWTYNDQADLVYPDGGPADPARVAELFEAYTMGRDKFIEVSHNPRITKQEIKELLPLIVPGTSWQEWEHVVDVAHLT